MGELEGMKKILTTVLIISMLTFNIKSVYAEDITKGVFAKVQQAFPSLDIMRTTVNIATSFLTGFIPLMLVNGTLDDLQSCSGGTPKENCRLFDISYRAEDGITADSRASGSLLGVALSLENIRHEPIPVNLAYYVNDKVSSVPFLGKAYAQSPDQYSPLVGVIYDFWKGFRNLAYGLLAIIMLVIGIMIINKTKLNQQAVVNVQYAVPNVIKAVILITFSYPIGATMASIGFNMMTSTWRIVDLMLTGGNLTSAGEFLNTHGVGGLLGQLLARMGAGLGTGLLTVLISIILLLLVLLPYIWAWLKAWMIYVKVIIKIIYSPLVFVYGAVPGNDDKMVGWFKEMLVAVISMVGIVATIRVGLVVVAYILQQNGGLNASIAWTTPVGTPTIVAPLVIPFILAFACYYATQIPNMVETAIMGPPKGKK